MIYINNMLEKVRTKKVNTIIENLTLSNFFIYNFFIVITYSAVFNYSKYMHTIATYSIKLTLLVIIMINIFLFLRGDFSLKECCVFGILGVLFVISYMNYKNGTNLAVLLYIAATKNIKINKILKIYLISALVGVLVSFISQIVFNIPDGTRYDIRYYTKRIRYALGFSLPTYLSHFFLGIACAYMLFNNVCNVKQYLLVGILNIIIFIFNDTKSVFICVNLLLILHYLICIKNNRVLFKFLSFITFLSYPLGTFVLYFASVYYDPNNVVFNKINSLTTGRIFLNHNGIIKWGVKLFGQSTDMNINSGTYNYIDSSYINILIQCGLIVLLIIVLVMMISTYSAYISNQYLLMICFFVMSLHGLSDTQLNIMSFNPTIFYIYPMVSAYIKKNIKNE